MRRRLSERTRAGFTLLEVMVAMGILAMLMGAITSTQGTSIRAAARVRNLTTATQLLPGIILDIEEEYRLDGFPTNTIEDRDCDLPRGFEGFECEYDLIAMDVGAENIGMMGQEANDKIAQSPLMSVVCGGGPQGGIAQDPSAALANAGVQAAALGALQSLLDPAFGNVCGLRLEKLCQNVPMFAGFIPELIKAAAASTRKLVVRLSWEERGNAQKTLEVETFLVSVPAAEEENQGL